MQGRIFYVQNIMQMTGIPILKPYYRIFYDAWNKIHYRRSNFCKINLQPDNPHCKTTIIKWVMIVSNGDSPVGSTLLVETRGLGKVFLSQPPWRGGNPFNICLCMGWGGVGLGCVKCINEINK